MNKRGNLFLKGAIIFMLWASGIWMIPFITDTIDASRTDLSCSTTTISFGVKSVCLTVDLVIPWFLWTLFMLIMAILIANE